MPNHKTVPILKTCPVCNNDFETCPPGRKSRYYPPNKQVFCSQHCALNGRYRSGTRCNQLTEAQAAYIAGFLDADGSVMLYRRGRKAFLRVSFTNRSRETLDWIVNATGVGNVAGGKRQNQKHSYCWNAFVNSEAAASLLVQVLPFMLTKRVQAEIAIDYHQKLRDPSYAANVDWQQRAMSQMKELNRRGAYPPELTVNE